jgi:4-amino-4-deoxy-L-arabinose transferase-like glycosyltransferase
MKHRSRITLLLIFALALFLRLFRVGLDGLCNLYYAATVRSMLMSWHNFFFASFDPAGFVSVDKPPLGFWVQALSARIFGFHGWSLTLPQALAGALSSLVLYALVRRVFGVKAGLLAALILALTPVSVATHRSNTPDGQLLLLLLIGALFARKAAESGQLRWLAASAALVGLGFNVKMLQAYLAAPAFFLFLPPPIPLLKRLGQLAVATAVMFSLSFAWPLAVDLTPASARPYVGSTVTNHVIELVAVHNGVRRLGPIAGWFGIRPRDSGGAGQQAQPSAPPVAASVPQTNPAKTWPDGGLAEVGDPGPLRLFKPRMAGQVSWLLPLALLALVNGAARAKWKQPLGREALFYLLWAGWLIPSLFFFSYGGLIHRYYLDMMAPPVAALSAAGLVRWARDWSEGDRSLRSGWLLPVAVGMTCMVALFFLGYYPETRWLRLPVALTGAAAMGALMFLRKRMSTVLLLVGSLPAILLVPLVWSTTPMWSGGDVILPYAGPDLPNWGGEQGVMKGYEPLAAFLVAQHRDEDFLAATENAVVAAPLQLLTGQAVMAMGGFTGADPILSVEGLADIKTNERVRFFLIYHEEPPVSERTLWIHNNCALTESQNVPRDMDLYDCKLR